MFYDRILLWVSRSFCGSYDPLSEHDNILTRLNVHARVHIYVSALTDSVQTTKCQRGDTDAAPFITHEQQQQ